MPQSNAARMSRTKNIGALLAYRRIFGRRTQSILRRLNPEALWEKPAPERVARIVKEKGVRKNSAWLLKFWSGNPSADILLMPITRHPFVHLNEIGRMMPALKRIPGPLSAKPAFGTRGLRAGRPQSIRKGVPVPPAADKP